jgi:addiction module RelB/DinJ family antitoxin
MPTTLFRARVDTRRKNHATKILKRYGLGLGEAVNVFLAKIEEVNGLPFDLRPDETTEILANEEFRAILADIKAGKMKYTDDKDIPE